MRDPATRLVPSACHGCRREDDDSDDRDDASVQGKIAIPKTESAVAQSVLGRAANDPLSGQA